MHKNRFILYLILYYTFSDARQRMWIFQFFQAKKIRASMRKLKTGGGDKNSMDAAFSCHRCFKLAEITITKRMTELAVIFRQFWVPFNASSVRDVEDEENLKKVHWTSFNIHSNGTATTTTTIYWCWWWLLLLFT